MPNYAYSGRQQADGKPIKGVIEAKSSEAAEVYLRGRSITIVTLQQISEDAPREPNGRPANNKTLLAVAGVLVMGGFIYCLSSLGNRNDQELASRKEVPVYYRVKVTGSLQVPPGIDLQTVSARVSLAEIPLSVGKGGKDLFSDANGKFAFDLRFESRKKPSEFSFSAGSSKTARQEVQHLCFEERSGDSPGEILLTCDLAEIKLASATEVAAPVFPNPFPPLPRAAPWAGGVDVIPGRPPLKRKN